MIPQSKRFTFPKVSDTMLMHYILDESKGTHGLKFLALKYTEYGDYDKDLDNFRNQYCKEHRILKGDFTYDLIPFDILFLPDNSIIYPDNFSTSVEENALSKGLESISRPHFFKGVLTVVLKLFNIINPESVFFGKKDYQQFLANIDSLVRIVCHLTL